MAITLADLQGRMRRPAIENPSAILEDHRTRYIYSPCETFYTNVKIIGTHRVGEDRGWSMPEITQGMIVKVVKRDNYDSNLTEAEMAKAAAYYRIAGPRAWLRDGETNTAGLVIRPSWPAEQVPSIIDGYGRYGVVELVSPLRYNDTDLPAGWSVEDTVEKVLDFVLHPKTKERVNIRETLEYFRTESAKQLEAPLETRQGNIMYLPPIVKQMGYELLEELMAATVNGIQIMLTEWSGVIGEITNRNTGKDRGKSDLKPHDIWLQQELGLPTPTALKLDYQKENENAAEERTAGLVERIMDRIGDKLRPAPQPQINKSEIAMEAAELAQQMLQDTLAKMAADGRITFNPEPKIEKNNKEKSKNDRAQDRNTQDG